ncbi:MAG: hydantoinase/oxoprolinase family protein, partial [Egibacteraceae bacterium]
KVPMVAVVTVGTGGGSIAWVPGDTHPPALKVGPRSAGADPGPICYAKGGTDPTVTDAAVVLGRIPAHLLGGEIPLDVAAAGAGLERLAGAVGMTVGACAAGVLEIAAWNQANAIRRVTVRRGLDVRDFALASFGGSGPLLACRLLDVLGLQAVLVPPEPGSLSAFGLLTVDVRVDDVRTAVQRNADLDLAAVGRIWAGLVADAAAALRREGFADDQHRFARAADLRYEGQAFEVRVVVPDGPVDAALATQVVARFHAEHERLYGYCYRSEPEPDERGRAGTAAGAALPSVEWVNLRVTGIGPVRRPGLPPLQTGDGDPSRARTGERPVLFDQAWQRTGTYDRAKLLAGDRLAGPAVVEEFGSTLPLAPGFAARVDGAGNLIVEEAG